jgi:hypothetical protein
MGSLAPKDVVAGRRVVNGTLNGAMRQEDADRAMSLLPDGTYRRVDATHVVHLAVPELYVRILEESQVLRAVGDQLPAEGLMPERVSVNRRGQRAHESSVTASV